MRRSFGNPIRSAAQVRENAILMEAKVSSGSVEKARNALISARYKLPVRCKIIVKDLVA
jgi:ribosomal protein L16/L10AE